MEKEKRIEHGGVARVDLNVSVMIIPFVTFFHVVAGDTFRPHLHFYVPSDA